MSSNETKNVEKDETKPTEEEELITTSDDKKIVEEEIKEDPIGIQMRRTWIWSVISVVFISIVSFIVFDEKHFNLRLFGTENAFQLSHYWHKLEFVLCYQTIGISWILFNMFYVISKRVNTEAENPLSGNEDKTLMARNIMTNSIEQFLMSSFAQIISISFIDTNVLIKAIPLINILFLIGRITFWLGYPKYRTFGFMCSAVPNTLLINYNLIKFIQSLFF